MKRGGERRSRWKSYVRREVVMAERLLMAEVYLSPRKGRGRRW